MRPFSIDLDFGATAWTWYSLRPERRVHYIWTRVNQDFEDMLTHGRAQWITVAPSESKVLIGFTDEPDKVATRRFVTFGEDAEVRSDWIDRNDDCMESLIGAHEEAAAGRFRYVFVTEQREIVVVSSQRARILEA